MECARKGQAGERGPPPDVCRRAHSAAGMRCPRQRLDRVTSKVSGRTLAMRASLWTVLFLVFAIAPVAALADTAGAPASRRPGARRRSIGAELRGPYPAQGGGKPEGLDCPRPENGMAAARRDSQLHG